ncbi:YfiH family protein [Alkalibacillus flavidus]|uniref:Purine nucleoside phosphorylase n=1 Tax=Alkalibacillus flavidus TaxID=546021 RepID=A0ABV2KRS7_9BACI
MQEPFQDNGTAILNHMGFEPLHVNAGFTTRRGGYSQPPYHQLNMALHVDDSRDAVLANRQYISDMIGKPLDTWRCVNQVHSTTVIDLTEMRDDQTIHDQTSVDADGMITNNVNHTLATFYADCVPLYFVAPNHNWIGLAHAGWRGTVNGMGQNMVDALKQRGVSPDDIYATVGPCISQDYYEVDHHVTSHIPERFNYVLKPSQSGRWLLDLKQLNRLFLEEAGLKEDHIQVSDYCTFASSDLFYSFRRDAGQTGRMMAYLSLIE